MTHCIFNAPIQRGTQHVRKVCIQETLVTPIVRLGHWQLLHHVQECVLAGVENHDSSVENTGVDEGRTKGARTCEQIVNVFVHLSEDTVGE